MPAEVIPNIFKKHCAPRYAMMLEPVVLAGLTAVFIVKYPATLSYILPTSLDLNVFPVYLKPHVTQLFLAFCGFVLALGVNKALGLLRIRVLRSLFGYHEWLLGDTTYKTKIWTSLVKLLKGPKPYSTFEFQQMLPRQPLPALETTLDLWLRGNSEWLSEEEVACTQKAVDNFRLNEGPTLQRHLEKKASREVSWLHEYWLSAAYLANRDPLPISSNYFSVIDTQTTCTDDSLAKSATIVHLMAQFVEMIEQETLNPAHLRDTVPLCMNGFKFMFNTVRVPGENMDSVVRHTGHRHVVVVRDGQYYALFLMAYDDNSFKKTLLTVAEIKHQLERIVQMSNVSTERSDVAALTTQDRTKWAQHREILNKQNQDAVHIVESAMFILCLDDFIPENTSDACKRIFTGNGSDRWYDKAINTVCLGNGLLGNNVEHSALDATVSTVLSEYTSVFEKYTQSGDVIQQPGVSKRDLPYPKRLVWNTKELDEEISTALIEYQAKVDDIGLLVVTAPYGKGFMKRQQLSPDGYIQMAIQLAYYRLHKKVPKTYEPSTGRLFALGRTETIHVTSPKSTEWVKSMDDSSASPETKRQLLKKAIECQNRFRLQATRGQGCDRHLLGLFMASRELGMDVPQIFMDKAWTSPYQLSTSQTPTEAFNYGVKVNFPGANGGFGPSCHDGYAVSYIIHGDDIINFTMTAYKSSEEVDLQKFADTLLTAMDDMKTFLKQTST